MIRINICFWLFLSLATELRMHWFIHIVPLTWHSQKRRSNPLTNTFHDHNELHFYWTQQKWFDMHNVINNTMWHFLFLISFIFFVALKQCGLMVSGNDKYIMICPIHMYCYGWIIHEHKQKVWVKRRVKTYTTLHYHQITVMALYKCQAKSKREMLNI